MFYLRLSRHSYYVVPLLLINNLLFSNFSLALEDKINDYQLNSNNLDLISQNTSALPLANTIEVKGNTIFESEINNIIEPLQNKDITSAQLDEVTEAITKLYLNDGYLTSRAFVETIGEDKKALIIVAEGEIQKVEIEGANRLEKYILDRIALGAKTPFNSGKLEDQLRLLKNDSLLENIEATIRSGDSERQSILAVKVTEANPVFGSFGIDNYSPPSVGATRVNLSLGHGNVFGLGDSFAVSYSPRIEGFAGTYDYSVNYSVPINAMNGTVNLGAVFQENKVVEGIFEPLDIRGESQFYQINYRQPLIRNPRQEFALSLGMSYRTGQTFTFQGPTPFGIGPDANGFSKTNVINFGQDLTLRDGKGAWAFRSQFNLGVGLFDVTRATQTDAPDGYFFSWLGQAQRVQALGENHLLIIQADLQLTGDPLLPSEQFAIGGGESLRGYRQNARTGDNGFRFSIEDRITLSRDADQRPVFQLAPFFDMGSAWNVDKNPNFSPSQTFLTSVGLGVIWQPTKQIDLRVDYAPPLVNLDDRGGNIQDDGLHFNLKYNF